MAGTRETWTVAVKVTVVGQTPVWVAGLTSTSAAERSVSSAGSGWEASHTCGGPSHETLNRALPDSPFLPMISTACQPVTSRSKVCRSRTVTLRAPFTRKLLTTLLVPSPRTHR
ncbi:hypothetical protein HII36_22400 [Nonomuraea sp. NN258]|nr:hypothetical protein [Nonomuraea antri]